MKKSLITLILSSIAVILIGGFFLMAPQNASAEAGPGGGGGSDGCSRFNYSTCFGAVWRYYRTTDNAYAIRNVGGGNTIVSGCGASGGFFAYVLVHKNFPSDPTQVRSWQIGPVDNDSGNRSIFFGGWTNYRIASNVNDPIPVNPSSGDYSWYSARKAFAQTTALGQSRGFTWDGGSRLGWFCYRGSDFNLTPTINGTPAYTDGQISANDGVSLSPAVNNSGTTASDANAQWRVVNFRLAPGVREPTGGDSANAPVQFFANNAVVIASGQNRSFPRNITNLPVARQAIADYPIGTKICYALSVQPITQSNSSWRHSTPFCVIIAKSPKAQVRGGDIRVGSNFADQTAPARSTIVTSQTRKTLTGTTRTFGSWGEYAVSATGRITGVGSGAAFAGPGLENPTNCSYTFLTIANATRASCLTTPATQYGRFATGRTLPDATTSYPASASVPILSGVVNPAGLSGSYRVTGDITLGAGVIPRGRSIIINAFDSVANTYRNVTISGNITYTTDSLANSDEIPQLIIIASNINIQPTVSQVDAWLVARGTLNTCAGVARTSITINSCNTPLTVNGPVMANQLQLWRTAGSNTGTQSGDPAEIFNLRPDAYLWGLSQSAKSGRLQTVYEQELPPRF